MFRGIVINCLLFLCYVPFIFATEELNDFCIIKETNSSGKCLLLEHCAPAVVLIKQNKHPQICGFQDTIPIVCCPELEELEQKIEEMKTEEPEEVKVKRKVGEIAEKKCWEYSELIYNIFAVYSIGFDPPEIINKSKCALEEPTYIINGENAKRKEFPHMALLGFERGGNIKWDCGGTLISNQYVLTAAHCFRYGTPKKIRLGELSISRRKESESVDFLVVEALRHPLHKHSSLYHDIALLKLDQPVNFTDFIRPACLQLKTEIVSTKFIATGWGLTDPENRFSSSDHLQKAYLELISTEECNNTYARLEYRKLTKGILPDYQICAGGKKSEDTCKGDSGGPLQIFHPNAHCMYSIIGVTSFGKKCGASPGVYTRVSNYIEWLENTVWP